MKTELILRLIELGKACSYPGFEDSEENLTRKFGTMPGKELLNFFELTLVDCHRAGIQ